MSQPYLALEAELHDAFWAAEDAHSELPLMADFLADHPGRALEIGCGSGRLLLPLVARGFDVEGLELSPDMLALCNSNAAEKNLPLILHRGDMSNWRPQRNFDALLVPAFTLQLTDDPAATLRHWHDWLVPGGGLYLTTFVPFAELDGDLPENQWYDDHQATLPDGRRASLETRHQLDRRARQLQREHRYRIEGTAAIHESRQTLRWFEDDELSALLKTSGFELTRAFLDFDPERFFSPSELEESDGICTYLARRLPT